MYYDLMHYKIVQNEEIYRIGALQEAFDINTRAQLDTKNLLKKLSSRSPEEAATVEELISVLELALAAAAASRLAVLEIHFAISGVPPNGA